ncbi:phage virion morphogenesis protein [Helicobacter gastrocanis]|nr:phage virion morphogenesis protein [Helicobacter sp. NHP19-003]
METSILLHEIKHCVEAQIRQSFEQQRDPLTLKRWQALKPASLAGRRYPYKPILEQTGLLRSSARVDIVGQSVRTQVNLPYARVHQLGYPRRNIPQRRYLPFDDAGKPTPHLHQEIEALLAPDGLGGQEILKQVATTLIRR